MRRGCDFEYINLKRHLEIDILSTLTWMPEYLFDGNSTLVQVLAWCCEEASHYLIQCWPKSPTPHSVTRPQRITIDLRSHDGRLEPTANFIKSSWIKLWHLVSHQNRNWSYLEIYLKEWHPVPNHNNDTLPDTVLTHWGRDKMAVIFLTTFSNAFSWMKMN